MAPGNVKGPMAHMMGKTDADLYGTNILCGYTFTQLSRSFLTLPFRSTLKCGKRSFECDNIIYLFLRNSQFGHSAPRTGNARLFSPFTDNFLVVLFGQVSEEGSDPLRIGFEFCKVGRLLQSALVTGVTANTVTGLAFHLIYFLAPFRISREDGIGVYKEGQYYHNA